MPMKDGRRPYDRVLLMAVLTLLAVGVVMVYSSSSVVALTTYNDPTYFLRRQVVWAALGLVFMAVAMRMDHELLEHKPVVAVLLLATFLLLAATFLPGIGRTINGARRWIKLGVLTFQPAELAKLTLVVYLSSYLSSRKAIVQDFQRGLAPAFAVTGVFLGMVLLQPDFGTVMAMGAVIL